MTNCNKCGHSKESHRDYICYGTKFCLCIKFEEEISILEPLKNMYQIEEPEVLRSHTNVPLPMFITTHDNWKGRGWQYKKKWGKTQIEMVEYLSVQCGLDKNEIRKFLRCKLTSVRGRLSEIRNRPALVTI